MQHLSTTHQQISARTIAHYAERLESFWQATRDHDVAQNIHALLSALPQGRSLSILDFGCGPGRDLRTFKELGHQPTGLDGCAGFCQMARAYAQCPVWRQDFLELALPPSSFDGIFANASLFHVPSTHLLKVLTELHTALKPQGVLFTSNPRGSSEGWQGERYGHYMEWEVYQPLLVQAGFEPISHYYRPPDKPRAEQNWLAVVSRKRG
ncbi:Methyltransferase type 11 [Magnetococcus marinus MC-1]|uniref:Methyltransferase type 11 n=1 Tax=Magnetococcus marinus (strain ATCC BAA-1437 / JCM 17883 / MC-1) TaxID=156889 RepID=A0LAM1_MAGMM|nr:class I SAM-dependent methyltransferase [Magnetococcus marinus]ABK45014.1 Methyltransferase type 11 [Magnetococcus marinus MC-1]